MLCDDSSGSCGFFFTRSTYGGGSCTFVEFASICYYVSLEQDKSWTQNATCWVALTTSLCCLRSVGGSASVNIFSVCLVSVLVFFLPQFNEQKPSSPTCLHKSLPWGASDQGWDLKWLQGPSSRHTWFTETVSLPRTWGRMAGPRALSALPCQANAFCSKLWCLPTSQAMIYIKLLKWPLLKSL